MPLTFMEERALEIFRSLTQISVAGMKLLALLNGGGAIGLLTYAGNISKNHSPFPDLHYALLWYSVGLVFCCLAFFAAYHTQLKLFNEAVGAEKGLVHSRWLLWARIFVLLSLASFILGCLEASVRFQG